MTPRESVSAYAEMNPRGSVFGQGPNISPGSHFSLGQKHFDIRCIPLYQIMSRPKSGIWPILGLKLAILATCLKISTSNLFCPAFTIRLIGKPNKKSIRPKITSLASKKTHKWRYLNSGFFKSVRH